jgi:hypothetical protein
LTTFLEHQNGNSARPPAESAVLYFWASLPISIARSGRPVRGGVQASSLIQHRGRGSGFRKGQGVMTAFSDQTPTNSQTMKEDDGLSASSKDIARDQWTNFVRTQIHLNEVIHRTRQLTVTVVAAAFGVAFLARG